MVAPPPDWKIPIKKVKVCAGFGEDGTVSIKIREASSDARCLELTVEAADHLVKQLEAIIKVLKADG